MRIKNYLPYLLALLPQVIFSQYLLVVLTTVLIGFLAAWFIEGRRVFLRMLGIQFVFFLVLFLVFQANISYLGQIMSNLKMPAIIVPILFVLFNTLNLAILFFFGYKVARMITGQKPAVTR